MTSVLHTSTRLCPRFRVGIASIKAIANAKLPTPIPFENLNLLDSVHEWPFTKVFRVEVLEGEKRGTTIHVEVIPEAPPPLRNQFDDAMYGLINSLHRSTDHKTYRHMAHHLTTRLNSSHLYDATDGDLPYLIKKIEASRCSGFITYTVQFLYQGYPYVQNFQVRGTKILS